MVNYWSPKTSYDFWSLTDSLVELHFSFSNNIGVIERMPYYGFIASRFLKLICLAMIMFLMWQPRRPSDWRTARNWISVHSELQYAAKNMALGKLSEFK